MILICIILMVGCAEQEAGLHMNPPPKGKKNLEVKKILSDKVEVLIPEGFEVMSEEMAAIKYPTGNRPTLIYTVSAKA